MGAAQQPKLQSKDKARRIAANGAKLPEFIRSKVNYATACAFSRRKCIVADLQQPEGFNRLPLIGPCVHTIDLKDLNVSPLGD